MAALERGGTNMTAGSKCKMPEVDRYAGLPDEWIAGLRAGDPKAVAAANRLLTAMAHKIRTPGLTARQLEVLDCMANGYTHRQIAAGLKIGLDTVKSHVKTIYLVLDARNRTHAVAIAMQRGLVE
jgi:DNA-binding CsgD family transcriptional regulator